MPPDDVHAVTAARLRVAIARLTRRLRQHAVENLTISQLSALATVSDSGELRLGDLAAAEGVSPSTLSRLIAGLEERGLVQRRPDEQDRRVAWMSLTPDGHALVARLRQERTLYLAQRVAALPPEERSRLDAALPVLEALAFEPESDTSM